MRIEWLWVEVGTQFAPMWKAFFSCLKRINHLNVGKPSHLWLLGILFLEAINEDCRWFQILTQSLGDIQITGVLMCVLYLVILTVMIQALQTGSSFYRANATWHLSWWMWEHSPWYNQTVLWSPWTSMAKSKGPTWCWTLRWWLRWWFQFG